MSRFLIAAALAVASIVPAQAGSVMIGQGEPLACPFEHYIDSYENAATESFKIAEGYLLANQRMPAIYKLAIARDVLRSFDELIAKYAPCMAQVGENTARGFVFGVHRANAENLRRRINHAATALGTEPTTAN